jgi:hypothetical protein
MGSAEEFTFDVLDEGQQHSASQGPVRRPWRRHWATALVWALGVAAAFTVYLRLASTRAVNSDGSGQALQAWDILHGNVLLSGWRLSEVPFYTTDIPQDILAEIIHGYGQEVVHIGAAMTYTLVMLFAALLAKGRTTGREAVVRVALATGIMLAPQLDDGLNVLISEPDHLGTSVPVMLTWLVLDRFGRRPYVPVVTSLLLTLAVVGDRTVLFIAVLPLVVICAVRASRGVFSHGGPWTSQRFEIALASGAIAAAVAGVLILHLIASLGGFHLKPIQTQLSPWDTIASRNSRITGKGFLLLAGADFFGLPPGASTFFVMLHLVGVALAACAIVMTACRFFRSTDIVDELLLAGIVINAAVFLLSTYAAILPDVRHMAPVLPFAACLAGRQLARPLLARRLTRRTIVPALSVVLAGYAAGLGLELTAPGVPAQNAQLTSWLESHHLDNGLSGYWESNVVTLTSGGRVQVRSVVIVRGRIAEDSIELKTSWYDPARSTANFFVLYPGTPGHPGFYGGFTDRSAVIAAFGLPARTYHVGRYTILLWHKNLLADLARETAHRTPPRAAGRAPASHTAAMNLGLATR